MLISQDFLQYDDFLFLDVIQSTTHVTQDPSSDLTFIALELFYLMIKLQIPKLKFSLDAPIVSRLSNLQKRLQILTNTQSTNIC